LIEGAAAASAAESFPGVRLLPAFQNRPLEDTPQLSIDPVESVLLGAVGIRLDVEVTARLQILFPLEDRTMQVGVLG
jgi:hypothetical protein